MKLGEPLDHLRIIVVKESGLLLIQSVNGDHIIGRQFEVKDVDVLTDTIRVNALRNADDASLKLPAKNDLSDRFAVFFADLQKHRVVEQIVLPSANGAQLSIAMPLEFRYSSSEWR